MSSLWDSRFCDESGRASTVYRSDSSNVDVGDILAATRSQLPYISPSSLRFDIPLGRGSSYQVTREIYDNNEVEPYYVAVKHIHTEAKTDVERRKRYAGVIRELRVLMHPDLRGHGCIVPALAYGWKNDPIEGARPYIILDFSDHGTLSQYLKRCNIPLEERRELALDVAVGIRALHECGIVHGDIKCDNVLVFDCGDYHHERPQVAKLADFNSSIFEDDFRDGGQAHYLGTMRYNAPEIVGRAGGIPATYSRSLQSYQKADSYTYGLFLWECLKNGISYFDPQWLHQGEDENQALERIFKSGSNALLGKALEFCKMNSDIALDPGLESAVISTFRLCLRDDADQRGDFDQICKELARGTRFG